MAKYRVVMMERWAYGMSVEADSPEEAIQAVKDGRADLIDEDFELRDTMDSETWETEVMGDDEE